MAYAQTQVGHSGDVEVLSRQSRSQDMPFPPRDKDRPLARVTHAAGFEAKVEREAPFAFGAITTTEVCNLTCVMCHFNGPQATKKAKQLTPEHVAKVIRQLPAGSQVYFAATGEFFLDPFALDHVQAALDQGLVPLILSHGQQYSPELLDKLLVMGVRNFRMSVDAIDAKQYEKIRRGGKFEKILETVDYLNARRVDYADISIEINCTLFKKTFERQAEFEAFWADKIDAINFNAEYYDTFRFRNIFYLPEERANCKIQTYVLPSGTIAPCCAMMVDAHESDVSWLPTVDTHTLEQAYTTLCDMYEDPTSELSKRCRSCEWWIMWTKDEAGRSAYMRQVRFPRGAEQVAVASEAPVAVAAVAAEEVVSEAVASPVVKRGALTAVRERLLGLTRIGRS